MTIKLVITIAFRYNVKYIQDYINVAGNTNSGRTAGKSLPELIQAACRRAIKQGNAGLNGQRALSDLLAETMQNDPLAFLRAVAPYVPKEIILDQSISITVALDEARSRLIDINTINAINDLAQDQLIIEHDSTLAPLPAATTAQEVVKD